MSDAQVLILIVVTALVSSLSTLALGWVAFQKWLRPGLEARLEALAGLLEARVKAGADAAGRDLLEPLRAQVRGGVEDAATTLLPGVRADLAAGFREAVVESLPALREEVRKGFTDAIGVPNAAELFDRTARKVVRTGSSLVESGMNLLRATRPDDGGRDESAP